MASVKIAGHTAAARNTLFFMVPKNAVSVALLIVVVAFGCSASGVVALAESFDKPVRETVVDLGPSPYLMPRDRSRIQLYCDYYTDLMVKELDDPGQKGTRWVTITPILNEQLPACRLSHGTNERFIAKGWFGFVGVKGSLLFLEAADGEDGGLPFRILDSKTGKVIFEDSAALPYYGGPGFDFARTSEGGISLKYLRVVHGDCSIPKDGLNCWGRFRQQFGLTLATVPTCTGYVGEQPDQPVPLDDLQTPSAIQFPVKVKLFPRPSIQAAPGPVKCRPIE
ncbi:MAG: hypothetical protein ABSC62_01610 [Terracidiphilus sp.]